MNGKIIKDELDRSNNKIIKEVVGFVTFLFTGHEKY